MDIATFAGPTPGDAKPGNLYADLGSRTLWLGVDAAVDSSQAVLISDIVGLQSNIDGCLVNAKAYTDSQIATRAPTSHTHTASQITDFTAAVNAVVAAAPGLNWVRGMIMQYTGSLADIGVGSLAGWALCDGSNGTPDLRDCFVLGAGNKPIGSKNILTTLTTSIDGAHTPVVNGTTLTVSNMPAHAHTASVSGSGTFTTGGRTVAHTHSLTNHSSNYLSGGNGEAAAGALSGGGGVYTNSSTTTSESADHAHAVNVNLNSSGSTNSQGGSTSHTHVAQAVAGHSHTTTSADLRDTLPYYALALIMKL